MNEAKAIIVMGVSGSGKTTVGLALAERLGWPFHDGDDFHPPANIDKMARGIPLNDADRWPWLEAIHAFILKCLRHNQPVIIACSALKQRYRDRLSDNHPNIIFVYLRGDYDLILTRMRARQGHFMKEEMLQSQFEALEVPEAAQVVDIDAGLTRIIDHLLEKLGMG